MDILRLSEVFRRRCWEEDRDGLDNILNKLGLTHYDPLEIVKKTHGVSYNDFLWFQFEGERLFWKDVARATDMFDVKIGKEFLVDTDGTSDGTQLKYFHDGFWYKEDSAEREGIVEYYVSRLLSFSTLPEKEYVEYEYGKINGKDGCRKQEFSQRR